MAVKSVSLINTLEICSYGNMHLKSNPTDHFSCLAGLEEVHNNHMSRASRLLGTADAIIKLGMKMGCHMP